MKKSQKNLARKGSFLSKVTVAGAVLASASGFAPGAHAQFGRISESDEIRAGEQVRQQVYRQYGRPLPSSDPRQQRANRLGRLFAARAERRNIPYSFTILNNDKVLNAFAAPGGPTFFTTKLVSTAANDAELAFVIAHEIGHIENKHVVKSVQKQQQAALAAGILGAILGRGGSSNTTGLLLNTGLGLLERGYSRENEREADIYAVRAMSAVGIDPNAAVSMLGRLGSSSTGGVAKYLATHPAPASRQTVVRDIIAKENLVQKSRLASTSLRDVDNEGFASADYSTSGNRPVPSVNASVPINLRVEPYSGYSVVMAPLSETAQAFGGRVETGDSSIVTISRGGSYARFTLDSTQAIVNGRTVTMSAPARVFGGRVHASVRTVMEGLGGEASYDSATNSILLSLEDQSRSVALR